jgi:hypothetical protein
MRLRDAWEHFKRETQEKPSIAADAWEFLARSQCICVIEALNSKERLHLCHAFRAQPNYHLPHDVECRDERTLLEALASELYCALEERASRERIRWAFDVSAMHHV